MVQGWFARYLDKIGITAKDKVFHSFRHTFETNAVENRVPMEYQNEYVVGQTMVLDNEYYNKKQRYMSDLK